MLAAVKTFAHEVRGGSITGFAAPDAGTFPSAVGLFADDVVVHVARATRFSMQARKRGSRLGWCGFQIPSAASAFALSSNVFLRCMASDRLLARISLKSALGNGRGSGGRHDVLSLLRVVRQETDADDIAQILPFADAHASEHGRQDLVEACYRMLLKRPASPSAMKFWQAPGRGANLAADMLTTLVASDEFQNDPRCHIPGPFHPEFRLTLSPLR